MVVKSADSFLNCCVRVCLEREEREGAVAERELGDFSWWRGAKINMNSLNWLTKKNPRNILADARICCGSEWIRFGCQNGQL